MLLDAVLLPGSTRSLASVCTNELIGIVGNSLVLPVAPGQRLDPTLATVEDDAEVAPVDLIHAYATDATPPLRVSVPTRGVYAEAVSGSCNSCEEIDDTRYWRFTDEGVLEPPEIDGLSTASRATDEPDLTPTPLPTPLVSIQNAPEVPDPFSLGSVIETLSKPELFRDVTGLEGTQKNAQAAFEGALSAASALGEQAHGLAIQQELGRNAGRMIDRIEQAKSDGLLTDSVAEELTNSALQGLIGTPRDTSAGSEGADAVRDVVDAAAQGTNSDIKITTADETVEVSFDDTEPSVGGSTTPKLIDLEGFVDQVLVGDSANTSPPPGARTITPVRITDFATAEARVGGPAVSAKLIAVGLLQRDAVDSTKYRPRWRLRIGYPGDPKNSEKMQGSGRVPVVVIVHGHKARSWGFDVAGNRLELPNHLGFDDLQRELARHGIVSVSVDMNAANAIDSLVQMRAEMVHAALDELRKLDRDPKSRFHKRLDDSRVGLVGHSRGGDAVVAAAKMNVGRVGGPSSGIKAVSLIAPTDFTGTTVSPNSLNGTDVSFLSVMRGALDADVSGSGGANGFTGTGFRHYDRATCDKSMITFDKASHNRFNEKWTPDERKLLPADIPKLLSGSDHRKLSNQYVAGLMRWQLLGHTSQRGLFDGSISNALGTSDSIQWSYGTQVDSLDRFEPGSPPAAGSRTLIDSLVDDLADIAIGPRRLVDETNHQTGILAIDPMFGSPPQTAYTLALPAAARNWASSDRITFRIAIDADLASTASIAVGPTAGFTVTITDADGASVNLDQSDFPTLHKAVHQTINKFNTATGALIGTDNTSAISLETMEIPKSKLTGLDLTKISEVHITPQPQLARHLFFDSLQRVRA